MIIILKIDNSKSSYKQYLKIRKYIIIFIKISFSISFSQQQFDTKHIETSIFFFYIKNSFAIIVNYCSIHLYYKYYIYISFYSSFSSSLDKLLKIDKYLYSYQEWFIQILIQRTRFAIIRN